MLIKIIHNNLKVATVQNYAELLSVGLELSFRALNDSGNPCRTPAYHGGTIDMLITTICNNLEQVMVLREVCLTLIQF